MKEQIIEFLNKFIFCAMATVALDGKPEAAFVGYRHNKNLELLIGTSNQSRKFKNLQSNPHVAVVMADTSGVVQYEGTAQVLGLEEYDQLVASGEFEALPGIEKYRNDPTQVFLKISPSWLRFTLHGESDQIVEMTEF